MHDDAMATNDPGFADIARRLEAFSDLRLTPTVEATARMRAEVMRVASRQAGRAALSGAGQVTAGQVAPGRATVNRFGWHRPFAVVLAAALALGAVTGTTYAARAGGALYETRIWVETLTLPSGGVARATAEVTRIEARLLEARSAMAAGDAAGTTAALGAYATIVAAATSASNGDAAATDVVAAGVVRQVAVLTNLASVAPGQAQAAIDTALASSASALDHLGADVPAEADDRGSASGGGAGPSKSGTSGNGPDDRGEGADKPAKSPKPSTEPATGPKGPKVDSTANDKGKGKGSKAASPTPHATPTPKVPPTPGKP